MGQDAIFLAGRANLTNKPAIVSAIDAALAKAQPTTTPATTTPAATTPATTTPAATTPATTTPATTTPATTTPATTTPATTTPATTTPATTTPATTTPATTTPATTTPATTTPATTTPATTTPATTTPATTTPATTVPTLQPVQPGVVPNPTAVSQTAAAYQNALNGTPAPAQPSSQQVGIWSTLFKAYFAPNKISNTSANHDQLFNDLNKFKAYGVLTIRYPYKDTLNAYRMNLFDYCYQNGYYKLYNDLVQQFPNYVGK